MRTEFFRGVKIKTKKKRERKELENNIFKFQLKMTLNVHNNCIKEREIYKLPASSPVKYKHQKIIHNLPDDPFWD